MNKFRNHNDFDYKSSFDFNNYSQNILNTSNNKNLFSRKKPSSIDFNFYSFNEERKNNYTTGNNGNSTILKRLDKTELYSKSNNFSYNSIQNKIEDNLNRLRISKSSYNIKEKKSSNMEYLNNKNSVNLNKSSFKNLKTSIDKILKYHKDEYIKLNKESINRHNNKLDQIIESTRKIKFNKSDFDITLLKNQTNSKEEFYLKDKKLSKDKIFDLKRSVITSNKIVPTFIKIEKKNDKNIKSTLDDVKMELNEKFGLNKNKIIFKSTNSFDKLNNNFMNNFKNVKNIRILSENEMNENLNYSINNGINFSFQNDTKCNHNNKKFESDFNEKSSYEFAYQNKNNNTMNENGFNNENLISKSNFNQNLLKSKKPPLYQKNSKNSNIDRTTKEIKNNKCETFNIEGIKPHKIILNKSLSKLNEFGLKLDIFKMKTSTSCDRKIENYSMKDLNSFKLNMDIIKYERSNKSNRLDRLDRSYNS